MHSTSDASDSEEEVVAKKTRRSPRKQASSKTSSGKETTLSAKKTPTRSSKKTSQKSPAQAKGKEIKSVSAFFGSAPIKRSSELRPSGPPLQLGGATGRGQSGRSKGRGKGRENGGGGEVVVVPESPTYVDAGLDFDDAAIAEALEEVERDGPKAQVSLAHI